MSNFELFVLCFGVCAYVYCVWLKVSYYMALMPDKKHEEKRNEAKKL